ncbi:response regulator [Nakamurella sp.]|uniref:response regulator transcription factor n=1 Tax=Nakamurella sp. TaxID=1869182 RepID=UPI003784F211
MALRVVLADDSFLVREGVTKLLADSAVTVLEGVGDAPALLAAVRRHQPDAVLTDVRMPPTFTTEGIDAARRIRADHPTIGVVVLSSFIEAQWCLQLVADGAAGLGYLLKDRVYDTDELVHALRTVARGGSAMDPVVIEGLLRRTTDSRVADLTDREQRVLAEMATGRSNGSIARSLHLSERSVEKHIGGVFAKLGLTDEGETNRRVAAVLAYLRVAPAGSDGPPRGHRPG